jgi:hypothetical protein
MGLSPGFFDACVMLKGEKRAVARLLVEVRAAAS